MQDNSESSVMFNLAEIMQLEDERVDAEHAAERARLAELERLRVEAAAQAQQERQREVDAHERQQQQVREDELQRRADHEATLLRTRLEVERNERLERERLALEHARALAAVPSAPRSRIALVASMAAGAVAVALAAGYVGLLQPRVEAERDRVAHAQRQANASAASNSALRTHIAHLEAARAALPPTLAAAPAPAVDDPPVEASRPQTQRRRPGTRPPRRQPARRPSAAPSDGLEDLDSSDPDPLRGILGTGR